MSSQPNKKRKREDVTEDKQTKADEDVDDSGKESPDSDEDSDDLDTDDSEDNQFINQEIQIDFSAYHPIDVDIDGIKCLLSQLWLKENISLSELTELLVGQKNICSVLKQEADEQEIDGSDDEDDEDVYGVTSIIPLQDYRQTDCIKQIKSTLLSYLPKDSPIYTQLTDSSAKIGFVINERFSNLPPKISLPSYQQLMNDLKSAKSDKQNQLSLDFEWFLIVCRTLKTRATNKKTSIESQLIYINAEEELFDELSDHSFEYSVAKQCDSDVYDWKDDNNLLEPFRRILLLSNDNWNKAIIKLKEEFK